jgi:hypothetical protein
MQPSEIAKHKTAEILSRSLVQNIQEQRLQKALGYIHPKCRSAAERVIVAYMDNLEQRDILLGHLRRRLGKSFSAEEYDTLIYPTFVTDYKKIDLTAVERDFVDMYTDGVAYIQLGIPESVFPHRVEKENEVWWLKPDPPEEKQYSERLRITEKFLQRQTSFFREVSKQLRENDLSKKDIQEILTHRWF